MRNKTRNALLAVVIGAGIATGIIFVQKPNTPPPPAGTFNVFLATTGNDNDATNCKRFSTPVLLPPGGVTTGCATAQKAYQLATFGDKIEVQNGTYPAAVDLTRDTSKVEPSPGTCNMWKSGVGASLSGSISNCITFQAAQGANVHWDSITIFATFVYFKDINFDHGVGVRARSSAVVTNTCNSAYGHDVVVENSVSDDNFGSAGSSGAMNVNGGYNISFINDQFLDEMGISGTGISDHLWACRDTSTYAPIHDVLFDGVTFMNQGVPPGSNGEHCEGISAFDGASNMTIVNSKFLNQCQQNISIEPLGATCCGGAGADTNNYDHWTFENNWFDSPNSHCLPEYDCATADLGNVLLISHQNGVIFDHFTFRNNSFYNGTGSGGVKFQIDSGVTTYSYTNNLLTGNIYTAPGGSGFNCNFATYQNNVVLAASYSNCTGNTALGTSTAPYVDGVNYNFDLNPATAGVAANFVPSSTGFPPTDIHNTVRSNPADAGSDEIAGASGANLWVDPNGGTCTYSSALVAYADAGACSSLPAAYSAVPNGTSALVLVKAGTYTGAQAFSGSRTGGMVTFQPEPGNQVTFTTASTPTGGSEIQVGSSDFLTIDGFTINGAVSGTTSLANLTTDVVISNNQINVGKKTNTQDITLGAPQNWTITGNTIGPSCCGFNGGSGNSPEGIRIGKPDSSAPSCTTQACNVTISDNLIQYVTRDCAFWPSSGYGTCPDTTCTNADGCHIDGIQIWGLDGGTITRNRLYGVECQGIFVANTNNSLQRNIAITNNAVSQISGSGCLNKGIYLRACNSDCAGGAQTGTFSGTFTVAFNTGNSNFFGPQSCTSCSGVSWNIVGNYMDLYVANTGLGTAACTTWTGGTWNYNIWLVGSSSSSAACSSTDVNGGTYSVVSDIVAPGTGNDLHLSGSPPALNFVPAGTCTPITTLDFDKQTRPQGTNCEAGADEG